MAKDRSFASKVAKSAHLSRKHCPVCGEEITTLHVIRAERKTDKGSWGYRESYVPVCKCNEKEIFG